MRVLILGANGFIGSALTRAILDRTDWEIVGIDLVGDKLDNWIEDRRLTFRRGDLSQQLNWVEQQIQCADVVVPLVAIPTPMSYVREPLRVFNVTFDLNLQIVRICARFGTRIVFPSSSEVYGICADHEFNEEQSPLVLGPVKSRRWIYACAKQMLERVILAHGDSGEFDFTIFRPFNWIGPGLDGPQTSLDSSSRVVTQFIWNLSRAEPLRLVDGGQQTRCFTYIADGIDCLMAILENRHGRCNGEIINIGNPANECSIEQLARKLRQLFMRHPLHRADSVYSEIVPVSSREYYGDGYEDTPRRRPCPIHAREILGWRPRIDLDQALQRTLDAHLETVARAVGLAGSPL